LRERPAEIYDIKGRRSGGSRFAGALATRAAGFKQYHLAPGERAIIGLAASDRDQARVMHGYTTAYFDAPDLKGLVQPRSAWRALSDLVQRRTRWALDLKNGASVEVRTSSYGSVRGRTYALAVADELAFWSRDDGTNPASEVLTAIRPGLATLNGQLFGVSTPYAKSGPLWDVYERYYGQDDDRVLRVGG
jgi:hypothetical protein